MEKPYILGRFWSFYIVFSQTELFLKNLAKCNCSGPPAFKCQRYREDWRSNQKPFHHYQYSKIIQSICSIYQIICEIRMIQESSRASSIFDHAWLIIIKVTLAFLNLDQHAKYQHISSTGSSDTADLRVPRPKNLLQFHAHFWSPPPKNY